MCGFGLHLHVAGHDQYLLTDGGKEGRDETQVLAHTTWPLSLWLLNNLVKGAHP